MQISFSQKRLVSEHFNRASALILIKRGRFSGIMETALKKKLESQQYYLTGEHSAVKICTWTKKALTGKGVCYKEKFYGIRSHLCCQISPAVGYCQNSCVFCWRELDQTSGITMDGFAPDDPEEIIRRSIDGQRKLLNGFGGHPRIDKSLLQESADPAHFAISLTGEPLLYPKINQLIQALHDAGKTTFVVTNGQCPEVIRTLEPPTQLYISVDAPNSSLFSRIERSHNSDGWERLMQSLDALKAMRKRTRTSLRFTMIKGMNDTDPDGWAACILRSNPIFVEVKAYMFVGSSRMRLSIKNMPLHGEVRSFAEEIAKKSGYRVIDEKKESRVVLLMKEDMPGRVMKFSS